MRNISRVNFSDLLQGRHTQKASDPTGKEGGETKHVCQWGVSMTTLTEAFLIWEIQKVKPKVV